MNKNIWQKPFEQYNLIPFVFTEGFVYAPSCVRAGETNAFGTQFLAPSNSLYDGENRYMCNTLVLFDG